MTESQTSKVDERRLWMGNLDPRISEYNLLKLMQKHGNIEKFDLLFHRTGPLAGQPRGYAFVTYTNKENAVTAKASLHNALIGSRHITVAWAHNVTEEETEKPKPEINIPALAMSKSEKKCNRECQIQAIEQKLKLMEHNTKEELIINKTVATEAPVISQFQNNKQQSASNYKLHKHFKFERHKPYNKHRHRR